MQFKYHSHHIFKKKFKNYPVFFTLVFYLVTFRQIWPLCLLRRCGMRIQPHTLDLNKQAIQNEPLRKIYRCEFSQNHTVGIILLSLHYKLQSFTDRKPRDCRTRGMIIFRSVFI